MKEKLRTFTKKHSFLFYILFLLIYGCTYMFYHNVLQPDKNYRWDISFMKLALVFGTILFMKTVFGQGYHFGFNKKKLWIGMLLLFPTYLFMIYNICGSSGALTSGEPFVGYSLCMIFFANMVTGLYEEVGIRGVLAGHMMRVYRHQKNCILKAVLLSSLLFGILHLNNIVRSGALAIVQCCYAMSLGIVFAAAYLRTKNLWACIITHSLIDFLSEIQKCFIKPGDPELPNTTFAQSLVENYAFFFIIGLTIIATVAGLFMVRKSKRAEIMELWNNEELVENEE